MQLDTTLVLPGNRKFSTVEIKHLQKLLGEIYRYAAETEIPFIYQEIKAQDYANENPETFGPDCKKICMAFIASDKTHSEDIGEQFKNIASAALRDKAEEYGFHHICFSIDV